MFEHTSWELQDGQNWAVLGPNGGGKSVLMKAISGQLPIVGGEIVYHFPAAVPQREISYVAFERQKTLLANTIPFYQARWNRGCGEDGPCVATLLEETNRQVPAELRRRVYSLFDLEPLLERGVLTLSNGERRKVYLARAFLRTPRLLILDNPFTGLDSVSRERLRAVLEQMTAEPETSRTRVLLVGTDPGELPRTITHILWVENGKVAAQGPREEVLRLIGLERMGFAGNNEIKPTASLHETVRPCHVALGRSACHGSSVDKAPLVQMVDVTVAYDGTQVLHAINWTVRAGEHWAITGPNGAGKTTLLSLILGDHPQAYANRVFLFGQRRGSGESIWEIKQQIGWVAPELHLYYPAEATCLDVVCSGFADSVGLYRPSTPAERKQATVCLEQLGLGEHATKYHPTPFGWLSEGEQRLVLIARALVKRPRLLICDEPCQGLDPTNRSRVLKALETAVADVPPSSGATQSPPSLIYVTHDNVFPRVITHLLRLDAGHIVEQGPWEQ